MFAYQIRNSIDDILLLHLTEEVELKEDLLLPVLQVSSEFFNFNIVFKGLVMMKGIESELYNKIDTISLIQHLMSRLLQYQLTHILVENIQTLERQKAVIFNSNEHF